MSQILINKKVGRSNPKNKFLLQRRILLWRRIMNFE
jgi:hypothetical protein